MCDAGRESWFWVHYESLKLLLNLKIYYTIACVSILMKNNIYQWEGMFLLPYADEGSGGTARERLTAFALK